MKLNANSLGILAAISKQPPAAKSTTLCEIVLYAWSSSLDYRSDAGTIAYAISTKGHKIIVDELMKIEAAPNELLFALLRRLSEMFDQDPATTEPLHPAMNTSTASKYQGDLQ